MDLLYPNTTYIHASHLTDEEWLLVRDSGGNVSLAPQIELQMGHGWAPAQKAESLGIPVGLSPTSRPRPRPTSSPRCTRSSRPSAAADTRQLGRGPRRTRRTPDLITARQVLRWATLDGAKVAGIADRTGSITPGKKADLVIIDGHAVNVAPIIDPVAAVVCAADISNVDTVIIDGVVRKRDGKLLADLSGPRKDVEDFARLPRGRLEPQAGWVVPALR